MGELSDKVHVEWQRGTVRDFDDKRGRGVITGPGGEEVRVHFSAIEEPGYRTLEAGQEVFYISNSEGWFAVSVRYSPWKD